MKLRTYIIILLIGLPGILPLYAARWTTHFAYNQVTQIAMAPDQVFAISNGSLYSVDKQTEHIRLYNRQSGLHSSGITCIHYDETGRQLIIGYETGKIDILSPYGVRYLGELYDKDMTQRKTIYNVTIQGRTAYLATHYGVQTLDLRENKLVDSYWLRPNGEETAVKDVLLKGDSIYAFTDDSLFCAAMSDNIVDYTVWKREQRSGRVAPDPEKGQHYFDGTDHWYAAQAEGIVRFTPTERLAYKPDGPIDNTPYALTAAQGHIWMVPGGRWASQNETPACVMHYDGERWTNITQTPLRQKIQQRALDFMNVAVDPKNKHHYFVTSYGTGLYEFDHDTLVSHAVADGSNTLTSADPNTPKYYTRLDDATYDPDGNLWFLSATDNAQLQCIDKNGGWHAVTMASGSELIALHTPAGLIIDNHNANYKWIATARYNTCVCLLDDSSTRWEASDDKVMVRTQWTTADGLKFEPVYIYAMAQDRNGRVWIGTDIGAAYIETGGDYFRSDAIVRPELMDNNGENPLTQLAITAICQAADGDIWFGTKSIGVYVLNSEGTEIKAHYTTDNSAMPTNGILSLAADTDGKVYIGTGEGMVEYDPNGGEEGLDGTDSDEELEQGSMHQWRLHFSYSDPQEIAATPHHIYAAANGSLFSVNREDESVNYWNKATGLNGNSIAHITYDKASSNLIIAYDDGRIDLLNDDGGVTQMPDLYMKAGSMAVTIHDIYVGSRYTYLAMPFGILVINPKKGEVVDTYYIGHEAASMEIQAITELGDTLYAFSYDRMYKASLNDNLVDYTFWKYEQLPCEKVQQAVTFRNTLYTLQHDSLYRYENGLWQLAIPNKLEWIHVSSNRMLMFERNKGLLQMSDGEPTGLSSNYAATDAVYSNGEYWLTEEGKGLVRLNSGGDDIFRAEGPLSNFGYSLHIAHDQLYVAPGGRWAEQFGRQSHISVYDGTQWRGIPWQDTWYYTGHDIRDAVSIAVDPAKPDHFFVATYGTGVFEFENYKARRNGHYDSSNSSLRKATDDSGDYYFTRTDGAMMDEQGNLWVLNATETGHPLHVRTPDGIWHPLNLRSGGAARSLETPGGHIWTDRRDSRFKWMFNVRVNPAVILLDDGGTPADGSDDRCVARTTFVDQNGNNLNPANFRCITQDHTNRIWIGTEKGIITIPSSVDFYLSNACRRIIIPRNDGTGLGDYLLGDEQITSMAVDGGNRMWIGTASSGLYLIEDDTITVAHFTETNSLLPSNSIQSIAIMPTTGEVFVGTDKGIASYRSDASEPKDDMSTAYAFPNPVRPDYGGYISITGLMENTVVNIVDAGGNLVCKTRSHGGTAVWDGKLKDGKRAKSGVYSALCNDSTGKHTVVKILFIQ